MIVLPVSSVSVPPEAAMVPLTSLTSANSPLPASPIVPAPVMVLSTFFSVSGVLGAAVAENRPAAGQRHRAVAESLSVAVSTSNSEPLPVTAMPSRPVPVLLILATS